MSLVRLEFTPGALGLEKGAHAHPWVRNNASLSQAPILVPAPHTSAEFDGCGARTKQFTARIMVSTPEGMAVRLNRLSCCLPIDLDCWMI